MKSFVFLLTALSFMTGICSPVRSVIGARDGNKGEGLPYDAEVEYIQSSGTQYIDISEALAGIGFAIELKWCPLETTNDRFIFGGGQHSSPQYSRTGVYGNSNPFTLPTGESVNILKQGAVYIYDKVDGEYIISRSDTMSSDYLYLFAQEWGSVPASKITARLFYVQAVANGELVLDMVPVRFTNESGISEGAMYDRVSGRMFLNSGTGVFAVGDDL